MAASVARALGRIKQDLAPHLDERTIERACRDAGHRWRKRKLDPVATIHLFVLQVLFGNTAIRHLRHLSRVPLNAAAYCRARMRLPPGVLERLVEHSAAALRRSLGEEAGDDDDEMTRWRGRRTWLTDATGTIAPDEPPLRRAFGQPHAQTVGCGFPVPKVLGLFDAVTGLLVKTLTFPLLVHEKSRVWLLHPLLEEGDLLVGDRGFCSYAHLALLSARGVAALFRLHQGQIVSFRPHRKHYDRTRGVRSRYAQKGRPRSKFVRRLGRHDQLVSWIRPGDQDGPGWMTVAQFVALPAELLVREVRYRVSERGHRTREVIVVTTLLDEEKYPREALAELYGIRWRVETHWRELKTVLGMRRLKCRTEAGVRKEVAIYALVYNLVRAVMLRAAARQGTTPDRVSFTDALRWLRTAAADEPLTNLVINPRRPGRYEPRCVKDYVSFPRMKRPRHQLRARLRLTTKGGAK